MSNKEWEGMSKRQVFREKRRRAALRNRLLTIGGVILVAVVIVGFIILPQVKPITGIQTAAPQNRPNVNRNSTGDPNAPVKLLEFSDYQCPFCKRFWSGTEAQVIDAYVKTGKVFFTVRSAGNFVSGNVSGGGGESENSAMAAYCAADQNKFWEMNDALFTNVLGEEAGSFTPRRLQSIAQSVGLDLNAYNSCYSSGKYKSRVDQDFVDAQAAGLSGTPYFVITYTAGGQTKSDTIEGAQAFSEFQQKLDAALTAAGAK